MNTRERMLAIAVLGAIVLAGLAVMANQFFLVPLDNAKSRLLTLKKDVDAKQERIDQITAQRVKLNTWKQLSLPADVDVAKLQYGKYLGDLMRRNRFTSPTITPRQADTRTNSTLPGRKVQPVFTRLVFEVQAQATLANLVDMLDQFYHTDLLQKIDKLSITRQATGNIPNAGNSQQQRANELNVRMTIEALVLTGADKREYLLPGVDRSSLALATAVNLQGGPGGLWLIPWLFGPTGPYGPGRLAPEHREYAAIAGKNIFFGAELVERKRDAIDVTQFVYLTDIMKTVSRTEATLRNRYDNRDQRLRTSAGFNTFRIKDDDDETLVQGTVLRIDERDVYFKDKDKYYVIHVGQSLKEAMSRSLKEEEKKGLGVAVATPETAPAP